MKYICKTLFLILRFWVGMILGKESTIQSSISFWEFVDKEKQVLMEKYKPLGDNRKGEK